MDTCLFCRVFRGEIPAQKVYEDQSTMVFRDIHPQAPVHLLAIHRKHYAGVHEIPSEEMGQIADLFQTVTKVVQQEGLGARGYRLVINYGPQAGQAVPHIHVHILAGRKLDWPPG